MTDQAMRGYEQIIITDSQIERDRLGRVVVLGISILLIIGIPVLLGMWITGSWFGYSPAGGFMGLGIGAVIFIELLPLYIVQVESVRAFVTVDQFASLLSRDDVYTVYGPGFHVSYPWEARIERNNVSLEEAAQSFKAVVNCKDGPVTVEGSFRLKPRFDEKSIVAFLGGVATIAEDLVDLIKAFISQQLSEVSSIDVPTRIQELNDNLRDKFAHGKEKNKEKEPPPTEFERRFGIVVNDVTIAEIRLPEAVEKTRAGKAEATMVADGTAILLGFKDADAMREAIERGKTITQDQIDRARDRFLAVSENIKMSLDANEYILRTEGATAEMVADLAKIAPYLGPALAAMARRGKGAKSTSGKEK